ncbi:MAG: RtcB family protein [Planctomycetota bacterium]|nr:RtcB family protein [Planctomycetota bacterium]
MWLAGPLPADAAPLLTRLANAEDVRYVRVMPDVHLAHDICIGTVTATERLIYPHAVGADIGCGMVAIAFDCNADVLANKSVAGALLARLYRCVPANRQAEAQELPAGLQQQSLSDPRLEAIKSRDGRVQLGTLGRGNHFLEFQADNQGQLWLMVHSGSRAIGQAIHDMHLAKTARTTGGLRFLEVEGKNGQAYLADMTWAADYAAANRRAMVESASAAITALCGGRAIWGSYVGCSHNHVRRESHFGQELWVHRKGAISAKAGEAGIIPGAMGAVSFHVQGRGNPESLESSSHGAGRVMSRTDARRRISTRDLQRQLGQVWYDHRLAEALRDEAPAAYRDVEAVLRAERDLTRILRRLVPLLCYKGT